MSTKRDGKIVHHKAVRTKGVRGSLRLANVQRANRRRLGLKRDNRQPISRRAKWRSTWFSTLVQTIGTFSTFNCRT